MIAWVPPVVIPNTTWAVAVPCAVMVRCVASIVPTRVPEAGDKFSAGNVVPAERVMFEKLAPNAAKSSTKTSKVMPTLHEAPGQGRPLKSSSPLTCGVTVVLGPSSAAMVMVLEAWSIRPAEDRL